MTYARRKQDEFTRAYIACLLWVNEQEPGAEEELGEEALAKIEEECKDFQRANARDLRIAFVAYGYGIDKAGHDFYLTRNRHGAGFWDRGILRSGDVLTAAAHAYGETYEDFEGVDHE